MGKPTGFMEYDRKTARAIAPAERIRHFNEFHIPLTKGHAKAAGRTLYELRRTILPGGRGYYGIDKRVPSAQPGTRVE